jgi:hypothetical protein
MPQRSSCPAFDRAAQENGLGLAWRSQIDECDAFASAFLNLTSAAYTEAMPKRRRNDRGEDFSYEFHYLAGDAFPNAYAFSGQDGGLYVGITASMYGLINTVCDKIFEKVDITACLDEDVAVVAARPLRLSVEFLETGQKDSIIFSNFTVDDELIAVDPPSDWRSGYASAGSFLFATADKYRVRDGVLSYIFHHEMGHLIEGHVGHAARKTGAGSIGEAASPVDPGSLQLAMEFQADNAASKVLAVVSRSRHVIAGHIGVENDWNRSVSLDILSIYLAHTILTMSGVIRDLVMKGSDHSGADIESLFHDHTSYPSAGVRLVSSLNTYIRGLEPMDALVTTPIDPQGQRFHKVLGVMKRLGEEYFEFSMMLAISRVFEDKFHADRKAILDAGLVDEVRRVCAPYAFGGV